MKNTTDVTVAANTRAIDSARPFAANAIFTGSASEACIRTP